MYKASMEMKECAQSPAVVWRALEDMGRRLARLEVAMRDGGRPAKDEESFAFGTGRVSRKRFGYIGRHNEFIRLSPRELALLEIFAARPNEVLARDMLLSRLWGIDFYGNTRTLDQHITRLRQKLGPNGARIITVSRVGYAYEGDLRAARHA